MGQHNNCMYIGAAALVAVAGLGIYHAHGQDDDALNALMRDLGALMQPAEQPAAEPAAEVAPPAEEEVVIELAPAVEAAPEEPVQVVVPEPVAPPPVIEEAVVEVPAVEPEEPAIAIEIAEPAVEVEEPAVVIEVEEPEAAVVEAIEPVTEEIEEDVVEVAEPVEVPVAVVVDEPVAQIADTVDPAILDFAHIEKLRREAEIAHAYDTLKRAKEAAGKGDYKLAQEQYDRAFLFLPQDDTKARDEARKGAYDALYNQAKSLYAKKDLKAALQAAQQARDKGNPKAPKLVAEIQHDIDNPPLPPIAIDDPSKTPQYTEKRRDIQSHLRRGRTLYAIGDYDQALLESEIVLRKDPYNTEAQALRSSIGLRKQEIHDIEYRGTREQMIDEIAEKWTAQGLYAINTAEFGIEVTPIDAKESASAKNRRELEDKMQKIRIPEVSFRDAKIQDVVTFLEEASREYDDPSIPIERRGVNFALKLPVAAGGGGKPADPFAMVGGGATPGDGPLINFTARYTTLHSILNTVMELSGMKYSIRENIVTIMPANVVDTDMFTRSYVVMNTLMDVVGSMQGEMRKAGADPWAAQPDPNAMTDKQDLKSFFQDLGVPFPNGSAITYVSSIGRLRVTNTAENLAKFDQVLTELNIQPRMVEIEARFVEVAVEALNSLGFEWSVDGTFGILDSIGNVGTGFLNHNGKFSEAVGNLFDFGGSSPAKDAAGNMIGNISQGNRFLSNSPSGIYGISKGPIADNIFNLTTTINGNDVGVIVHMLAQKKGTDLLSAPKVLTRPGMPAVMKVTREYIYPREFNVDSYESNNGDSNNIQAALPYVEPADFNFDEPTDVGVILEVTPEVSAEGQMITMALNPRVVELFEWIDYGYDLPVFDPSSGTSLPYHLKMEVPIFSRREVNANISIYNGATVVMGGMITEVRTKVEDKIPYIGDIPYIGQFFRSTIDRSEKRNLLIFVTAKLVDPAGRPVQASELERPTLTAPAN